MSQKRSGKRNAPEKNQADAHEEGALYSLASVATSIDVPVHVLKFWEAQLPRLQALRGPSGAYSEAGLETFRAVADMIYNQGLAIPRVRSLLDESSQGSATSAVASMLRAPESPAEEAVDLSVLNRVFLHEGEASGTEAEAAAEPHFSAASEYETRRSAAAEYEERMRLRELEASQSQAPSYYHSVREEGTAPDSLQRLQTENAYLREVLMNIRDELQALRNYLAG